MVSVIIPMYNASRTIKRCLLSLMKQSYHDLEIIVIDDGSTDGGRDIVSDLAKDDERIRYIRQENGGVSSARNHGVISFALLTVRMPLPKTILLCYIAV